MKNKIHLTFVICMPIHIIKQISKYCKKNTLYFIIFKKNFNNIFFCCKIPDVLYFSIIIYVLN